MAEFFKTIIKYQNSKKGRWFLIKSELKLALYNKMCIIENVFSFTIKN